METYCPHIADQDLIGVADHLCGIMSWQVVVVLHCLAVPLGYSFDSGVEACGEGVVFCNVVLSELRQTGR